MQRSTPPGAAFTLVEVMIVVAIIGLLLAIAVPNFVRVRQQAQTNACINNLRLIDAAKQQWALEFKQLGGAEPDITDIDDYLIRANQTRLPNCPASGTNTAFADSYDIREVTNAPACIILPADHLLPF